MVENGILQLSGVVQLRGGTSSALSSENPLLLRREIAVEVDTGRLKAGDGVSRWNSLPYIGASSTEQWTFVLDNDTEIVKEVAAWTSGE